MNVKGYYFFMRQAAGSAAPTTRRRGEVLERAIYEATRAELAEVGYAGLTVDRIAARAQTGKAALYRRWTGKRDLVRAALLDAVPQPAEARPGLPMRENLLAVFCAHRDVLSGKTGFPSLTIIAQLFHDPELRAIFADAVIAPRVAIVESILQAAITTGELDEHAVTPLTAMVGPALINQHFLTSGEPPSRRQLEVVVDTVMSGR